MAQDVEEIYNRLERLVMPESALRRYKHPEPEPGNPTRRLARNDRGEMVTLQSKFAETYDCFRCGKEYKTDAYGRSLPESGTCRFHHRGRRPVNIGYGRMGYYCCKRDESDPGCCRNQYHVHRDQPLLMNYSGYVQTQPKPHWPKSKHGVYAIDCEMCYTVYGSEPVKVAVVDHNYKLIYKAIVKPTNIVIDYYPLYTGLDESDMLYVTKTLADVQQDLLRIFSSETILVGHGLENDLVALKMFHKRIVDTTYLYPHPKGLPYKYGLRRLAEGLLYLNMTDVSSGKGHDDSEDAIVAMRLARRKARI